MALKAMGILADCAFFFGNRQRVIIQLHRRRTSHLHRFNQPWRQARALFNKQSFFQSTTAIFNLFL
jgi:hypothetical protein